MVRFDSDLKPYVRLSKQVLEPYLIGDPDPKNADESSHSIGIFVLKSLFASPESK